MSDGPTPITKPKRKWRKRLLWLTAILCVFLWALNGPIARWGVHYAIDEALLSQGMAGDCKVKGTLRTGFTLSQFDYIGTGGLQKIQFSQASADYRLLKELIHGKVRGISLTEANVVIDLGKFIPSESDEETSIKKIKETIGLVRELVRQPKIQLSDIDVSLLQNGELLAEFQLHSLHHAQQSDDYQLTGFKAKDGQRIETPLQDALLTWTDSKIDLSKLEVLPDVAISEVHADWSSQLKGIAQLQLLTAEITVELSDQITAQLRSGSLDSTTLAQRFKLDLPLEFSLNSLDATVDNWLEPLPTWQVSCDLDLANIEYDNYHLQDSKLHFNQKDGAYDLKLETVFKNAPLQADLAGTWTEIEAESWWLATDLKYKINCPQLANIPSLIASLPKELELKNTSVALEGEIKIADLQLVSLDTQLKVDGIKVDQTPIPPIQLDGNYRHLQKGEVKITSTDGESTPIKIEASYTFLDDKYQAAIAVVEKQPLWINNLLAAYDTGLKIENSLNVHWQGSGHSDLAELQVGKLTLSPLSISYNKTDVFELTTGLEYQWPKSISLNPLKIKHEDFTANAELLWDGEFIQLSNGSILKAEESVATITAKIPLTRDTTTLESFLAQETPWLVDADSKLLPIQKIRQWLKLEDVKQMDGLEGTISLDIELVGSPHQPDIKGNLKLEGLRGIANEKIAPLHILAEFKSQDQRLGVTGVLNEAENQRIKLDLAIPFTPLQWVQKSEDLDTILEESQVDGKLEINTFPLNRIARLLPQVKDTNGLINGAATISGNLLDPKIELDTRIEIPILLITNDNVDHIRDILIECKANSDRIITANLKATVNGALLQADAKVDINDLKNPLFEVNAKTDYAMVFRNDAISVRANAKLKLAGSLEDATLSGDIGFVESLFYKDIDILPIGVPSSAVSEVKLPAIDTKHIKFLIPEPFDKWKLDLKVSMQDPLLIRGNIADGQIEGSIKATGTFAEPALQGTIYAKDVVAKLPFSTLKIHKGEIKFHPRNGLIPTLDIQGKSVVSNYDTSIFVYGLATAPKTTFTSFPPLAKNDIMTLLATGVTAKGLSNNKEAATLRALQLFLAKIKQESGQTRSTKILERVISSIDDFEFNINETNGFTGRKFSSAKINLNPRIFITAQVDEEKQTRGLVVFILKFR